MGRRGPKPTPDEIKKARGNPGHRPLNEQAPVLPPAILDPPTDPPLGKHGLAEWNLRGPMLVESGVLTAGDILCFETYCRIVDDVYRYTDLCQKVGDASAHAVHYDAHLLKLRAQLRQYLAEIGGTPSSRSGVKVNHVGWKPPAEKGAAAAAARKARFFGPKLHHEDPPATA